MYRVTIHDWRNDNLEVSPYLYWKHAMSGLVTTNVPLSFRDTIARETHIYLRQDEQTIYRELINEELILPHLSPPVPNEIESWPVMNALSEANESGISEVANKIGMYIPPHLAFPGIFFENNVKYYVNGPIITDQKIFDILGYIPHYICRIELLNYIDHPKPVFYYAAGSYYYFGQKIDTETFINPATHEHYTHNELLTLFSLTEMISNSSKMRLALIKMIYE